MRGYGFARTNRATPAVLAIGLLVALVGLGTHLALARHRESHTPRRPGALLPATSTATTAAPSDPRPAPPPGQAQWPPAAMNAVASSYIRAREDAAGADQSSPGSWLGSVRRLITPAGYATLRREVAGGSAGEAWALLHRHHWQVLATVTCSTDQEAGRPSTSRAVLACQVIDTTVGPSGSPVPAGSLPELWAYEGAQPTAYLVMAGANGHWLVAADETGRLQ